MFRAVLILLLILPAQCWSAGIHKWVDEKGETHYGDALSPQDAEKGSAKLDKRGRVVDKTSGAMTADERKAQDEEAKRKKDTEQKEREQKRRDNALLDSYTSEQDIDMARDRSLQASKGQIESTMVRIKSIQGRLEGLRKQADSITRHNKPIPTDLATEIKVAESEIKRLQDNNEKHKEEMEAIRVRFENDKQRYRELHSKQFAH